MKLTRRITGRGDQQTPRRILFADDDPSIATLIQVTLNGPRYDVVVVKNGLEALKAFSDGAFDIVLLDVMMPYVDGFEACKRIREQSDVPIIMLTARDGTDDIVQGFELGSDDYITKPFKTAEVIARIEAILRRVDGMKNRQAPAIVRVGDIPCKQCCWCVCRASYRAVVAQRAVQLRSLALTNRRGRCHSAPPALLCVWINGRVILRWCLRRLQRLYPHHHHLRACRHPPCRQYRGCVFGARLRPRVHRPPSQPPCRCR